MDYNISCLKHGMPLQIRDLGCIHCQQERLSEMRSNTKREYFDKLKTMEFWTAVVNDDGPEGKAYALHVLDCIQSALRRADG